MFERGFPNEFKEDVSIVLDAIPNMPIGHAVNWETSDGSAYTLQDGQNISFPYRIYVEEIDTDISASFSSIQMLIYHAIYTRSCNGYIREKHVRAILEKPFPIWVVPYIVKLADEYVVEILVQLYEHLSKVDTTAIKAFCRINISAFLYGHARMVSYWDAYYRDRYYYDEYVGKRLFEDCFGYTRCLEKLRCKHK